MTTKDMVGGPDEDEHYQIRELGHPNKSFRTTHEAAALLPPGPAQPMLPAGPDAYAERSTTARRAYAEAAERSTTARGARRGRGGSDRRGAASGLQLSRLPTVSAAAITGGGGGGTQEEQVRASKNQAIEILRVLDAESMLDRPVSEYIEDVEASYSDAREQRLTFPKLRAAWTREEDRLLMVGVHVYGPNTESWPRIAMLVPGRTNKSCRKRWFHSLDPTLHKGPWTTEEDELLRQRVAMYPTQWSRVAEGITGRTDDQCAKRWRESLDPEIDRGKWRPEEDRLLLEKYAELGTQWQKIATFFQGRPGLHCRNRWRKIQRVITQKEKKSGHLAANDLSQTLESVTESVNRRKTAHRTRPHTKPAASRAAAPPQPDAPETAELEQPVFCFSHDMTSPGAIPASLEQADQRRNTPDQLYQTVASLGIPADGMALAASLMGSNPGSARGSFGSTFNEDMSGAPPFLHRAQTDINLAKRQQQQVGSPESMGALYMPSNEQPTSADGSLSFTHGSLAGVKRSNSGMYSPPEEQRQRLRQLGLKLYGCAASPTTCEASFADSLSLSSHLKRAHPSVAVQIPSLNVRSGSQPLDGSSQDMTRLRPYKCVRPGCGHTYRNVSGLEYHIFQSVKAKDHLVPLDTTGSNNEASDSSPFPDSPQVDGSNIAGSQEVELAETPLQCSEVDCLAVFASVVELRNHVIAHHPRPIRRATKPSYRSKTASARNSLLGGSGSTPLDSSGVMWAPSTTEATSAGVSAMPMIPENEVSMAGSSISMEAMMAAISYQHQQQQQQRPGGMSLTPGVAPPLFSPAQQQPPSLHHHHSRLGISAMPNPVPSYLQAPSAPFMSAPALTSATGGEPPNPNSYFALGASDLASQAHTPQQQQQLQQQQQQQQLQLQQQQQQHMRSVYQNPDSFTPMILGTVPSGHSSSIAPPALPSGAARTSSPLPMDRADSIQLGMDLMQSVLSPFYTGPDNDGDVRMGEQQQQQRDQRSDSVDLSSLATVPTSGQQRLSGSDLVESPLIAPSALSKTGTHSQMATALLYRRGRENAAAAASGSGGQQGNPALSPWAQDLSALGLLPTDGTPVQGSSQELTSQKRPYTPHQADLAQFQLPHLGAAEPGAAVAQGGQKLTTSVIGCPAHGCMQTFSDANSLKNHLHFDHPRDETVATAAGHYSNPGSPMVSGFLSTLPNTSAGSQSMLGMSSADHSSSQAAMNSSDRAKPHWIDPSQLSMWIEAANGQGGNVAAAAIATAMGITPGVAGPQSFIPPPQSAGQLASESELLQMLEAVGKDPAAATHPTSMS
ncbi:hypothetical protein GGF46_003571 [Coemansia sp. RSA 552]|nr:hypothetical protein GGF46_003571 [Coemansia sp. RSA 552]